MRARSTGPPAFAGLLRTFGRSRVFWLVCILSLGMTLVRETFNLWTPTYFTQAVGLTNADAAQKSALFPLFGGISVLLSGFLSDRLGRAGRAGIILCGMILAGATLLVLGLANFKDTPGWPVALVALVAFLIIGPYAYLAGAIALDFGGKQGSGTASGLIDGVGYLGGVLAGNSMANIAVTWGWKGAFAVLAGVTWLGSIAAALYFVHQRHPERGIIMNITEQILDLFQTRGHEAYFGEGVSQREHALQAAWLAETANARPALVVAALLHDIGHLIHGLPENIAEQGVDGYHEAAGAQWLECAFWSGSDGADPAACGRQALFVRHRSGLSGPCFRRRRCRVWHCRAGPGSGGSAGLGGESVLRGGGDATALG